MLGSLWRIFEKAGEPGWACLVPIYNLVVLCRIGGVSPLLVLACFVPLLNLVAALYIWAKVAERFHKSSIWALGLVFLSFIFIPMLAFSADD